MRERLTTLAAVKDWLDINTDDSDTQLTRLIDAASQFILNYLNRDSFKRQTYTQNFSGMGKRSAILYNWPVLSVISVGVAGTSIAASSIGNVGLPGSGYVLTQPRQSPQSIELFGYAFYQGAPSQVVYDAGYEATQETVLELPVTDPVSTEITVTPNNTGQWIDNISVTIDGVEAVEVTADPSAGEYSVDEWGTYTFSGDDDTKTAIFTYSYVPWDVSFAVTELIGEWYKRKDRIGVLSKTLGGQETITFSQKDMGDSVRTSLQPYMNVVPM